MSKTKQIIRQWAKQIGERRAVGRLIAAGVGTRAAEQLCAGTYPFEPKSLRNTLMAELSKDGFTLAGEEAS